MEICSDPVDQQQISNFSEDYQLADGIRKAGKSARFGREKFKSSSELSNGSFSFPPGIEREASPSGPSLYRFHSMEQRSSCPSELSSHRKEARRWKASSFNARKVGDTRRETSGTACK
jgi:hypothetical protein